MFEKQMQYILLDRNQTKHSNCDLEIRRMSNKQLPEHGWRTQTSPPHVACKNLALFPEKKPRRAPRRHHEGCQGSCKIRKSKKLHSCHVKEVHHVGELEEEVHWTDEHPPSRQGCTCQSSTGKYRFETDR